MGRYLKARALPAGVAQPLPADPNAALYSDRQMWGGYTPVVDRFRNPIVLPDRPRAPATQMPTPGFKPQERAFVHGQLVAWQDPPYRAKPIDATSPCTTLPFYETWYSVATVQTETNEILVIDGINYQSTGLARYEVFEVSVLRETEVMATWEDMLIAAPAVVNPALKYAFGGTRQTIPLFVSAALGQRLVVQVRVHGLNPFTHTAFDPLGAGLTVTVHGYRSILPNAKDGRIQVPQFVHETGSGEPAPWGPLPPMER